MELDVNITKKLKEFTLKQRFKLAKETLGFLGASGSGKSMTLKCIAGLEKPDSGRIVLNGRVLFDSQRGIDLSIQDRRVGLLFQNYALFPNLTVRENIAFGLRGMPKKEQEQRVQEQMAMLDITDIQHCYPQQISGGEQQRTALARTLVTEPECLLLDEPFSALDNHIRSKLEQQLLDTVAAYKGPVVFVTHNLKECYRISQKIMIIHQGKLAAFGSRDQVFANPQTVQAARLTGCKNISRIETISPRRVKALDWGVELDINGELGSEIGAQDYLGIREHRLRVVENANLPNTFPAWVEYIRETPFDVSLALRLREDEQEAGSYQPLQVMLSKEDYEKIQGKSFPWLVQLRSEHLFLMKQEL